MNSQKRLYRSTTDEHIAGVCGGIAEYLEIDPTLVRLVFVALTVMGGPGIILYIILWMVVPEEPKDKRKAKKKNEVYYEDVVRSEIPTPSDFDEQEPLA